MGRNSVVGRESVELLLWLSVWHPEKAMFSFPGVSGNKELRN